MTALDDAFDARDAPHAEVAVLGLERRAGDQDLAAEGHTKADDTITNSCAAHREREGAGQGSCSNGRDRHLACVRRGLSNHMNVSQTRAATPARPTLDWWSGETRLEA